MSKLTELRERKKVYQQQLENKQRELANYEDMYDSLSCFKNSVEWSYSNFMSANVDKENAISIVHRITTNSDIAKKYLDGMQNNLKNVGGRSVGEEFQELLLEIKKKQRECMTQMGRCESEVSSLRNQIVGLSNAIAITQKMLEVKRKDET